MWILRSIIQKKKKNTHSEQEWEIHIPDPPVKTLMFGSRSFLFDSARMPGGPQGLAGLQFGGVCWVKSHLLKVFVKQRSCCVTVQWKLPSDCMGLCNHHKRTYQQSKSITHPHKQTLMSVNEAELQPLKGETWLLRRSLMKANNAALCWREDGTGDWKVARRFVQARQTLPWNFPSTLHRHLDKFTPWWILLVASHLCCWVFVLHFAVTERRWQRFGMIVRPKAAGCYFWPLVLIIGMSIEAIC